MSALSAQKETLMSSIVFHLARPAHRRPRHPDRRGCQRPYSYRPGSRLESGSHGGSSTGAVQVLTQAAHIKDAGVRNQFQQFGESVLPGAKQGDRRVCPAGRVASPKMPRAPARGFFCYRRSAPARSASRAATAAIWASTSASVRVRSAARKVRRRATLFLPAGTRSPV